MKSIAIIAISFEFETKLMIINYKKINEAFDHNNCKIIKKKKEITNLVNF